MKLYKAQNLREFDLNNDFYKLSVNKRSSDCTSITSGSFIAIKLGDIQNKSFFEKCVTKEYQELFKKVLKNKVFIEIYSVELIENILHVQVII